MPNTLDEEKLDIYWKIISSNNNAGLTEHLLANADKLNTENLLENNNPGLTDLIVSVMLINKVSCKHNNNPQLTDLMLKFGFDYTNNNPLLAPHIMKKKWNKTVCSNTCPLLADYIMSGKVDWKRIVRGKWQKRGQENIND